MEQSGLSISNPNPQQLPGHELLHQLIGCPADATAIDYLSDDERMSYTYQELHNASDSLCRFISQIRDEIGDQTEMIIPVLIPQCPQLYISLLAVLKAGGAFCPLNLDAPPERVKFILEDVSAKMVLVTKTFANRIPAECSVKIIQVDLPRELPEHASVSLRTPTPQCLAYVMYTSGSTGTPKGVGISHRAATQALLAHDRLIPAFSRFLQFAAPTFDVSVFEIFFPLFRGSTLVSISREMMLRDLPAVIRNMEVDACELTPSVVGSLLKRRDNVPNLRILLTIGEMLRTPLIQEFGGNQNRKSLLWAMYGPTEATIHCTLQPSLPCESSPGNIGLPLDNVSCFVIAPAERVEDSQSFQILPIGEAGELAVGGSQLARGYINRTSQTAAVFIDSPFGRVYRTGDKAVMKPNGSFECLGRLSDGQVKLRGQRIELGEIEHAALRTPGCHDAKAAIVDASLVLFCAVESDVDEAEVEARCKSWLPAFMIPNDILLSPEFPRLPSGKVDTKRLQMDFSRMRDAENAAAEACYTSTEHEGIAMKIISETLCHQININSRLSSAGIDSISAIKAAASLRLAGFDISVASILESRTVRDLCSHLQETAPKKPEDIIADDELTNGKASILCESPPLGGLPDLVESVMPCTALQRAMLAVTEQNPSMYCNEILLQAGPHITAETLSAVFHDVIQRTEILRSGFITWGGRHMSVIFMSPRPEQVVIQSKLQHGFNFSTMENFLFPFKVQLLERNSGEGVQILIQAHHAIYDGWSMDMLLSDISLFIQGTMPAARPQFMNIINFERHTTETDRNVSREFWSRHLLGWTNHSFPKLIPHLGPDEICTDRSTLDISPELLHHVSKTFEISNQVVFQAAVALVWQGVVGQTDILLGSVVSGRTIPVDGIERIIGPCIASMPLRVNIGQMKANIDLLKRIHTDNRAIMKHWQLPLSEVKKLAGISPSESLYDVLFVYQQPIYDDELTKHTLKQLSHVDRVETKLLVEVEPLHGGFALQFTYHSAFFSDEFVDILAQQIKQACKVIIEDPMGPLLSPKHLENVNLAIYNAQIKLGHGATDVSALVYQTVERYPDAEAIRFATLGAEGSFDITTMTYSRLNAVSNQIARHVQNQGAQFGDVIAVVMKKSPTLYISILGIVKAGCAYLPITPTTPDHRIREMLHQTKANLCLVDNVSLGSFAFPDGVHRIVIDSECLSHLPQEDVFVPSDPDRLAYVIFTSGTTGVPKGVGVTQRNLASNISYLSSVYPTQSSQPRLLQACSYAFDVSVFEIFYTWHTGMSLCAAENDVLFQDLEYAIRTMEVTHLSLTPTVAGLLHPKNVPSVEFLVTAGEPMTLSVLDKWHRLLFQGYGPSETTNICSVKRMSSGDHIEHLGWVFPNTSVSVLLPGSLDILPQGWVGEFCFGGSQVARGYINDELLTNRKFIEHPELGRIYRSGDLGRMLPDGSLIILGRLDDQLKLRGQRVEANEINSVVTSTALVTAAVTMLVQDSTGRSDQLATFYCAADCGSSIMPLNLTLDTNRMLFSNLQSRLPSYMIPSYLIPIPNIPMTGSGKVDKRQLHHWFSNLPKEYLDSASAADQGTEDENSWTQIESTIAEVIAKSLEIPRRDIGRWTPFPALGIDSISAIALSRSLRQEKNLHIAISVILQNASVAQLGQVLSMQLPNNIPVGVKQTRGFIEAFGKEITGGIGREIFRGTEIQEVWPCTPLQESMLLQSQGSYFNNLLLRLHIPPERVRSYWELMTMRHSVLRTCFVTTRNVKHPIAQVVLREWTLPWQTFEATVSSVASATREHLRALPDPLDSMAPPFSMALIKHGEHNLLSLACHHALYDGIAMETLCKEVEALAHGQLLQEPISYLPFLQQSLTLPTNFESFWKEQFRGFHHTATLKGQALVSPNQATHTMSIDMSFREIHQRTRSLSVSLLSLCQASWASVLSSIFDDPDVVFGNVVSGRTIDLEGIDRLVAPCFNTIPLRMNTSSCAQNIDLVKAFHDLNAILLPYQFTPLKTIQKIVAAPHRNLCDTLLLLQQPLREMDDEVWTLEEDSGAIDVLIVCEIVPCAKLDSLILNLHYDMDIISGDLASKMSGIFNSTLRSFLSLPFAPLNHRLFNSQPFLDALKPLALKAAKLERAEQRETDSAQWSDTEEIIRKTFAEISDTAESKINRHTTMFQLGLDSINSVQIASTLKNKGMSVSSTDVIECPSCSRLAIRIIQNSANRAQEELQYNFTSFQRDTAPEIRDVLLDIHVEAILPCTPVQNAMLASFVQSSAGNYLNYLLYKINSNVKPQSILNAWKRLQKEHPMLRTGFVPVQHQESAYAMVRQPFNDITTPVAIFDETICQSFDLAKWRDESRLLTKQSLNIPPWSVALVATANEHMMHINIHHALYDAQSLDALFKELGNILNGRLCTIPDVESTLARMVRRTNEQAPGGKEFWESLALKAVVNKFPTMTPLREEVREVIVHEYVSSMSPIELRRLSTEIGISTQAVLQTAWARVLASYLGEHRVVFGVTLSGRTTEEDAKAPFPCIVTIPVVAEVLEDNLEMMQQMLEYNSSLHKYQFTPLSKIQKWLGYAATPLFDTILVYQNIGSSSYNEWKLVGDEPATEYVLSLEIEPESDQVLLFRLTAQSDVVPFEQVELICQQFDAILGHLLREPLGKENDMYLSQQDIFSILPAQIPNIEAPVNFVHEFVEKMADTNPNSPALEFVASLDDDLETPRLWSYQILDLRGNQVAHMLSETVNIGDIIAIHFPKCPEAYFSILGILKAGCSFVALDPSAPDARKQFILRDSNAKCLLTVTRDEVSFAKETKIITLEEKNLDSYPKTRLVHGETFTPQNTCYCLYTSGTTGTPKGCEITHENTVQALMAFQHLFQGHWDKTSRWLQFAALHFDVSVLEQYWSWSVGITVVAAPKELILDDLVRSINKMGITHIDLTPSLAKLTHPDDLPHLCKGIFITGGESLNQEILDAWGPKEVIYNAYGPTEATIGVTMYQRVPRNGRPSNIGKPFPNVGSYVFHNDTEIPVLRGGVGELCVGGKLVGKGYLHRPEMTAERFPMLSEFKERIYRTGDLVRVLHDGCFDFLGRADDQVKLRGQRLEIGEINHIILGLDDIKDAATLAIKYGGKDVLVTFLVGQKEAMTNGLSVLPDDDGISNKARASCLARLPGYMVPTYYIPLSFIPLSPNNKIEAKQLKILFGQLQQHELVKYTGRSTTIPNSQADRRALKAIIRSLSRFRSMSENSIDSSMNIFDLGIDSISALQLSTMLKSNGMPTVTPTVILRNPVIADLAVAISQKSPVNDAADRFRQVKQNLSAFEQVHRLTVCRELRIKPESIEYIAPCSPLQEGMLLAVSFETVTPSYFNWFNIQVRDDVQIDKVRQAWERTALTFSILRSVFVKTSDGYLQVALRAMKNMWKTFNVTCDEDIEHTFEQQRVAWFEENSSHMVAPLQFVQIDGPGVCAVQMHIFHGLYDGISFELMNQHATKLYQSKDAPSGPSFVDALCHGPFQDFGFCKPFWSQHLERWQHSVLPNNSVYADDGFISLSRHLLIDRLEALRHEEDVTLQTVVLSIWTIVLQSYTLKPLTMGVIVSGRAMDLPHVENTVGPLFNTIPYFSKEVHGLTWKALVRRCYNFNIDVLPFQHIPLKKVQQWCSDRRPLFDNLFSFQVEGLHSDEDTPWVLVDQKVGTEYSLAFEVTQRANRTMDLRLVARKDSADYELLKQMMDHFEQIVRTVTSDVEVHTLQRKYEMPQGFSNSGIYRSMKSEIQGSPDSEASLCHTWTTSTIIIRDELSGLLGVSPDDIAPNTTILDLGIDSIDAIKLSAMLEKRNLRVNASQIIRQQSVQGIASAAEVLYSQTPVSAPSKIETRELRQEFVTNLNRFVGDLEDVDTVLPATALQESMVASMIQSDFELYFNHDVLELDREIDIAKLRDAWINVISSSPILRTGFVEVDDNSLDTAYCQVVLKQPKMNITLHQITNVSELQDIIKQSTETALQSQARKDLFQVALASTAEKKYMVISMAHALYDGWSLGLIYDDLKASYCNKLALRDYEKVLKNCPTLCVSSDDDGFWQTYLASVSPTIFTKPGQTSAPEKSAILRDELISNFNVTEIGEFCKQLSISVQALTIACWATVAAHLTQSMDTVFGVVFSGRDFKGAEDLVFPTMNTVPVRCVLHGSVHSFLKYMEGNLGDIRDHQRVPLRKSQAAAGLRGKELFNSLFIFQKFPNRDWESSWRSIGGASAVDLPVCVEAEVRHGKLIWRVACREQLFSKDESARILKLLEQVLEFFLVSSELYVLSFHGQLLSMCGLPDVQMPILERVDDENATIPLLDQPENYSWSSNATLIRQTLSKVSTVPIDMILPTSTLYHLGLDSISAIKVSLLLRKSNIIIKPRDLIQAGGIIDMVKAANTESEHSNKAAVAVTQWEPPGSISLDQLLQENSILEEDVEAALPATAMQVYMLSAWINSNGSLFFPEFCYELKGEYSQEHLLNVWNRVIQQVPILRTRFLSTHSKEIPWIQVIMKSNTVVNGRLSQPLLHLQVSTSQDGLSSLIQLNIHHSLYDAFSLPGIMQLFYGELRKENHLIERPNVEASFWSQYAILPTVQSKMQSRKRFWTEYLADCSSAAFDTVNPSPGNSSERVSYLKRNTISNIDQMKQRASSHGISIQSLFLAAYAKSLHVDSNMASVSQTAVLFGVYLANRTMDSDMHNTTYPTLNLVPLRVHISRSNTLVSIATTIHAHLQAIQAEDRIHVGLWEIYEWTGIRIRSFVNFLSSPDETDDVPINFRQLPAESTETVSSIKANSSLLLNQAWARNNIVGEAYPPALDIEASVQKNSLDVGIFGSNSLSHDEAPQIVDRIVQELVNMH